MTGEPFVLAVCGEKHTGKTTLVERLVAALSARGLRVATVKHDGHEFAADVAGTDSYRHRAAGAYASVKEAARVMASPCSTVYYPDNARREAYEALYREYRALHTYFGEGGNQVMERLRAIAAQ